MHYEKMLLYLIYVICPSSTSEMNYIVSGGALKSTHSLTLLEQELSPNSTWLDSTWLDTFDLSSPYIVEQHSSTRPTRRARLARHVEFDFLDTRWETRDFVVYFL